MNLPPALVQFLGSLAAILALAGVTRWLRLGPAPRLADEAAARTAADEAANGFEAVALALDRNGSGAVLRDAAGRIVLLRPHGTHFAGRLLGDAATARIEGGALLVDSGERPYGTTLLEVPEAQAWADAINAPGAR